MPTRRQNRPADRQASLGEKGLKNHGLTGEPRRHTKKALGAEAAELLATDAKMLGDTVNTILEREAIRDEFAAPPAAPFVKLRSLAPRRQLEMLNAIRIRELADLGRQDFWLYLSEILYAKPSQRKHYLQEFHGQICQELQDLQPGENFLLCLPREHRKSMLLLAYLSWLIIRDPNIRIKLIAKDQRRARELSRLLREMFHADYKAKFPTLHEVYPEYIIKSRRELLQAQQFTLPLRTEAYLDPTVFATFLGSAGAGGRCDLMVIDDGWDAQTLSNPDQGVKVMQQMIDLIPTVEGSALGKYRNVIVLTTPWKYYDPTAIILGFASNENLRGDDPSQKAMPQFKVMVRHAKESADEPCTLCPKWVTDKYPHGQPDFVKGRTILEPIFTDETLQDRYEFYQLQPELGEQSFFLQYMCVYHSTETAKFQPEWFVWYNKHDFDMPRRRVLVLDDASKDFQQVGRGDYSVAKFGSFDEEGRLLKRHALRSNKWTRDEFIRQIVAWCQMSGWWPQVAAKEKVGVDNFLVDLQRAFNQIGRPIVVVPVPRVGLGRKLDYIVGTLQGPYERGEVIYGSLYPKDLYERDVYELVRLGSTAHDDMPDADCLFFAKDVRVTRTKRLGASRRHGMSPLQLERNQAPNQFSESPIIAEAQMNTISQVSEDERIRAALTQAGLDPDEIQWTHRTGPNGPGQQPAIRLRAKESSRKLLFEP